MARVVIRRSSTLRRTVKSPLAQWMVQTLRGSRAVRPAPRFTAGQLGHRTAVYRLRDTGSAVVIRHRSRDVDILNEIFGGTGGINCYAPPPEVAQRLNNLRSPKIMDLGANIGLFGLYAFGLWPDARVLAYEPDPANAALLEQTIRLNNFEERWEVRRCACSNHAGVVPFAVGRYSESRIVVPGRSDTLSVPVVDLLAQDHNVDLLKMDIEGSEWAILADPRFSHLAAGALVLEWHGGDCPEPDPHATAHRLLVAAGYRNVRDVGDIKGCGVVWAWR
jgi:FkbM family methyltransferase